MMDYRKYTAEDFALDPYFRKWVLHPNKGTDMFWEEWLTKHPEKTHLVKEGRDLVLNLTGIKDSMSDREIDMLWHSIDYQVSNGSSSAEPRQKVIPLNAVVFTDQGKAGNYQKIGKLTASVLIIFCIGLSLYLAKKEEIIIPPTLVKHENSWGKKSTIFLSDGTEVILNSGSSIEYYKGFSENERNVKLHGEAFFKVARDNQKPFKVISGEVITEVLGTSFNIKAYDPDLVKVAVVTGKVSVDKVEKDRQTERITLSPGEEAQYKVNRGFVKNDFDPKDILSWTKGIIYFRNASEAEVINSLERWYGVKIEKLNESKKEWDYTASFKNQSLEHVLISIGYAMDFDFKIDRKSIVLAYE
jgi:transmembrane sensor